MKYKLLLITMVLALSFPLHAHNKETTEPNVEVSTWRKYLGTAIEGSAYLATIPLGNAFGSMMNKKAGFFESRKFDDLIYKMMKDDNSPVYINHKKDLIRLMNSTALTLNVLSYALCLGVQALGKKIAGRKMTFSHALTLAGVQSIFTVIGYGTSPFMKFK